jgi:indolepyruvate ferredoxin oxidoreductase alpha subunit
MGIKENTPGTRVLLMGNEAIARGAVEAGVQLCAGYPGTPSSEIIESLAKAAEEFGFYVEWSTNEVVALEVAAGAAMVGARSIFTCKSAGLNVAMDMVMTLPYTGVRGGLVIVVADDPGAWYSSNEQDSRLAGMWAQIPVLEPKDQQSAKEMTKEAFELSEQIELPVIVRSCTRLSHASGDVILGEIRNETNKIAFDKHWKMPFRWNVYGPPGVVTKHKWQKERNLTVLEYNEKTKFNQYIASESPLGVITSGMASNYVREALIKLGKEKDTNLLVLGTPYPIPPEMTTKILEQCDRILCVEEGEALIERQILEIINDKGLEVKISGRLTKNCIPHVDELNPDKVLIVLEEFLGLASNQEEESNQKLRNELSEIVCSRSSTWCAGCPHMGSFWALKKALPTDKVNIINTGIGCYEMSGYGIAASPIKAENTINSKRWLSTSPYDMTDTLYIMGSETGISQGQYQVGYRDGKIVSILGDSSFFHTNMSPIVNAVYNKSEQLIIVLDNYWTAMTGHQPNPSTGFTALGEKAFRPSIQDICMAFGVKFVQSVDPYDLKTTRKIFEKALEHKEGPSVVIAQRVCALQRYRDMRRARKSVPRFIVNEKCTGCKLCIILGCPAIGFDSQKENAMGRRGTAFIDPLLCVGCGLCAQDEVCRFKAHDKVGEECF